MKKILGKSVLVLTFLSHISYSQEWVKPDYEQIKIRNDQICCKCFEPNNENIILKKFNIDNFILNYKDGDISILVGNIFNMDTSLDRRLSFCDPLSALYHRTLNNPSYPEINIYKEFENIHIHPIYISQEEIKLKKQLEEQKLLKPSDESKLNFPLPIEHASLELSDEQKEDYVKNKRYREVRELITKFIANLNDGQITLKDQIEAGRDLVKLHDCVIDLQARLPRNRFKMHDKFVKLIKIFENINFDRTMALAQIEALKNLEALKNPLIQPLPIVKEKEPPLNFVQGKNNKVWCNIKADKIRKITLPEVLQLINNVKSNIQVGSESKDYIKLKELYEAATYLINNNSMNGATFTIRQAQEILNLIKNYNVVI